KDYLIFLGHINDSNDLAKAYSEASVLIFPSFYEASPLPPIEALTYGSEVVASNIHSLRERCWDAALYCDPNELSSIYSSVVSLLDDDVLLKKHVDAGHSRAREYTWAKQVHAVF